MAYQLRGRTPSVSFADHDSDDERPPKQRKEKDDEYQVVVGEDDDLPKLRNPRAKSTGRHRANNKPKSDLGDDALDTAPATWSPMAVARLEAYALEHLKRYGSIRSNILAPQLQVEGFKFTAAQITNKIHNMKIVEKLQDLLKRDTPTSSTRDSIMDEVLKKFADNAVKQANYSSSRKGTDTHLQSAVAHGMDFVTLASVTQAPSAPRPASPPANNATVASSSRPSTSTAPQPTANSMEDTASRSRPSSPIRASVNSSSIPLPDKGLVIVDTAFSSRSGQVLVCVDLEWTLSVIVFPPPGSTVRFSYHRGSEYKVGVTITPGAMDIYDELPDILKDKIPADHFSS